MTRRSLPLGRSVPLPPRSSRPSAGETLASADPVGWRYN